MFSLAFETRSLPVVLDNNNYYLGISCPSRSFPVHHAPDVGDISEDEGHKERDIEHGAEGELAAATV